MPRLLTVLLLSSILPLSCAPSGRDRYAGWSTYEGPDERFTVRYLSPPWTECTESEYEEDCHECPEHLLGNATCGSTDNWIVLWIPPALLDPDYLLIPPYKLEISWTSSSSSALDLAVLEHDRLVGAGLESLFEARAVTLADGVTLAAETGYRGPVHLVVNDTAVNRPDEREYRVVYVNEGGTAYRIALDTAIEIELPEVRDMLASFSLNAGGTE